ncbi:MAG: NYN domain-containing protein [Clostridia bacterium]|nr:NYN domain-containing protein [Clostridia bacterium]
MKSSGSEGQGSKVDEVLIVDGYNLLHAWPEMVGYAQENLEDARLKLLDLLADYQGYKGNRIFVVFDAHRVKGGYEKLESHGALQVIYTGEGDTADSVIERLVGELVGQSRVFVATSDYDQQKIIFGRGAYRISARELIIELKDVKKEIEEILYKHHYPLNRREVASQIDEKTRQILEKWRRQK